MVFNQLFGRKGLLEVAILTTGQEVFTDREGVLEFRSPMFNMCSLVLQGGRPRCIAGLPNLLQKINEWLLKKHGFFFEG